MTLIEKRSEYQRVYTKERRNQILEKFNHTCVNCGCADNLQIDHIIALSLGGGNEEDNLQVLCKECNLSKGGKRSPGGYQRMERSIKVPCVGRFNVCLMNEVEKLAKKENRNLTNYIETNLIKIVEESKKKKK